MTSHASTIGGGRKKNGPGDDDDKKKPEDQVEIGETGNYNMGDDIGERIGEGHDPIEDEIK
ncbi:MAG: hypothetical protein PHW10_03725 [Candidatus Peribacteraceae bacterium]|nr:hypothetical protein [Candidatus Peribacteraceae bacterium]